MKCIGAGVLFVTLLTPGGAAISTQSAPAPTNAGLAFAQLKRLVGTWEARAPRVYGNAVIRLQYRLMSDDSVLVETFRIDEQDLEMLTVYHLDGDQLALTHFCAVNNQIRMLADLGAPGSAPAGLRSITFKFRDGSNLERSHQQVMDRLDLAFDDDTHITQTWHWRDHKTPTREDSAVYRYTRVR